MSGGFVFHPFRRPEISLAAEFTNYMSLVVSDASLGSFDDNLWGLAIAADVDTESVDAYLWFDTEPSSLDRDEMGELASAFDNFTDGAVALTVHWRVETRLDHGAIDHSLSWIHLRRSPLVELADDFDERDLKY